MSGKSALDQFQRIRETRDIISGIHNYCDRWCERCAFTSRCTVFAMGEEEERIRKESNEPEKDLASYVGAMLEDAMELLHDLAKEHGIDFDALDEDDTDLRKPGKDSYLVKKSDEHAKWLFKWLGKNNKKIEETLSALNENSHADYLVLQDALEVLKWYIHFIAVKFSRASLAPFEDTTEGRSDNNGSAKIAIIAVNRSIEALALVLRFLPSEEDVLLEALVRLERIKKRALKVFPEAMDFKRPGFDD
ncbi:MAG: hypothetical protein FD166_309 [Bacteroidetes bacterium]|nr:MAG: hypothetical protein FD166_309 [Bacteroidota bacterium]